MELQQIIRVNDDLVCVCVREDGTTELPKWNDADLQPVVVDFQARAKKLVATMAVDPPRTKKSADVAGSRSTVQVDFAFVSSTRVVLVLRISPLRYQSGF